MADPSRGVRVSGPLASHKDGLTSHLRSQGYTPQSIRKRLFLLAQISRWLAQRNLQPSALTRGALEKFLRHRRRLRYIWRPTVQGLDPVLSYLRRLGLVPSEEPKQVRERTALTELLTRYETFLSEERSLGRSKIDHYRRVALRFLSRIFDARDIALNQLRTADVSGFILTEARRSTVTALRSLLRFLHIRGETVGDLSGAVPAVASWRLTSVPKAIDPDHVRRLLLAFDRHTRAGRRGYAVVLLMLRLGLRAAEVASLRLDDCDWARGELVIRGKRGREDRLPIPEDVGEAIASYLRFGRPRSALRGLFLSQNAPLHNMTSGMVIALVRLAGARCGIENLGAHQLRHTAATQMLRQGASLPEIGQVLRHQSVDTTAIYAKVDYGSLRLVYRPWPEVTP